MNLDKLIAALIEAKELDIDGRSEIFLINQLTKLGSTILDVKYDSKNVIIYHG